MSEELEKRTISVEGMTCAACVSRIEKALASVDGVDSASVNLVSHNARLIYDPLTVKEKDVLKAVKKAGYEASFEVDQLSFMQNKQLIDMRRRFFASLILALPVFVFAMGHMYPFNNWFPVFSHWLMTQEIFAGMLLSNFLQLALTTPIQFIIAFTFYKAAWKSLINKSASMDVLVVLGTSAAYFYSLFSMIYSYYNPIYSVAVFFETSAILLTFIFLGKYLEEIAKGKTSEAIKKLIELRPDTATVEREGKEIVIPIDDVQLDDICLIKPGDSVPVDGTIIEGQSYLNESMITGESVPIFKEKGANLTGGTINENGFLKMRTTRVGADTTLNQIIKMVDEAQTSKIPIQKLADRISAWFVPAVLIIALITFAIWFTLLETGVIALANLPETIASGISSTFLFAFLIGITVIVISCPCALGLATPTAIMVGTGLGASNGILIRSGDSLEIARKTNVVLLDKTGTITEGAPKVTDIVSQKKELTENKLLQISASLEKGSEHSIAKAIVQKAQEENIALLEITDFKAYPGKGIEASINPNKYYIGNRKIVDFAELNTSEKIENEMVELEEQGKTVMLIIEDKEIVGIIAIADTIKPTSKQAVEVLKQMGIKVVMVTGDNERAAKAIGLQVGIDEIHAGVLPEQKVEVVTKYQNEDNTVLFVGDGVNDSPALAQSDVGVAIGSGTDVAIETGDIVLVKDDLRDVVTAIDLSKKTIQRVKMGLFWALAYNTIGIPIAAGILVPVGFLLPAVIAGLAMALSSVSVVTNSLLLKRYKNPFVKKETS
ncbi:MAG: copper-translocating P-type ATPase [Candidatus Heimdallarchaeota archaeon]|nr:copper-translocating P-type ATPase [Candidatus Heimdallarchaeota archaeon]